ncbi:MAG: FAD-binding oxidoreductase [Chloroflexi bacterium]|nr:FAD-binding oxidoreductase [Chloroflexota bacterium]
MSTSTRHLDAFAQRLRKQGFQGEFAHDAATRYLYSTDASMYQIQPLGVAIPRTVEDVQIVVSLAAEEGVPVLPRGGGTSLAGQAVGEALVLDFSVHFRTIHQLDVDQRQVTVDVGLPLADLNRVLARHGLQFGPDPASAAQATVGGVVGNNATGAHSIAYGMTVDHVLRAATIMADGSQATWEPIPLTNGHLPRLGNARLDAVARFALKVRTEYADLIRERWPRTWRRASGYSLAHLLPWAPARPAAWPADQPYPPVDPNTLPLQVLLAGSEGTLAVVHQVTLNVVPIPQHKGLALLAYPDIPSACADVPRLLELGPVAVELLPGEIFRRALAIPLYARMVKDALGPMLEGGIPAAVLLVEFAGDDPAHIARQVKQVGGYPALHPEHQEQIWAVRKVGLGLLMSRPGDLKPIAFLEDMAVPVEHLAAFVTELQAVFDAHQVEAVYYAHASAGCLHIRPWLNLKAPDARETVRSIAREAMALVRKYRGVPSGEHGDGLARSQWLRDAFGPEIYALFEELKDAADPQGLLNPGKIVRPLPMDQHWRFGPTYRTPHDWTNALFPQGLAPTVERCTGVGVCRKSTGAMCPSYQVGRREGLSTRGRANLLRALLAGHIPLPEAEEAVFAALDLCLACQGCRAECPSGVDMAKLKWAFLHHYYQNRRRPWRDYLFGYLGLLIPYVRWLSPVLNRVMAWPAFRRVLARALGLAPERGWPRIARRGLTVRAVEQPTVLFLRDGFTDTFEPLTEAAAVTLLEAWGERVRVIPRVENGRALLAKGFLDAAQREAQRLLAAIQRADPTGQLPIVGVEPAAVYHVRDHLPELVPTEAARSIARRTWLVEEWLIRHWRVREQPWRTAEPQTVYLHGHCYQRARPPAEDGLPVGVAATRAWLEQLGYHVEEISRGCCGMAGAFGYEAEHYTLSLQVGEHNLFPQVRALPQSATLIAPGFSCRHQIHDALQRGALHPIAWVAQQMGLL